MPPENKDLNVQLLFGPPPILPSIKKQLKEHILVPDHLPIHDCENAQQFWKRVPDLTCLFHTELTAAGTTLKVERDFTTGKLLQFREVPTEDVECTAQNSFSMRRAPLPFNESVRGNDSNFPFLPAGFPEFAIEDDDEEQDEDVNFEDDLLWNPPGWTEGIEFKEDGHTLITEEDRQAQAEPEPEPMPEPEPEKPKQGEPLPAINLVHIMKQEVDTLGLWKDEPAEPDKEQKGERGKMVIEALKISEEEDVKVIPTNDIVPVLKISKVDKKEPQKVEWAEEIDTSQPVYEFFKKIPKMAHKYDFDLDIFQQQAILKVEEHSNVFVAAHTSAGKTVVAEYAIALSQAHKTKTIYTSPIKALSNQKFRDFKQTFGDVGLITGDIQLNQQANCLIMTTEILRSMLYQGSDVVRDLEFVIFDEVHYINNAERGHVWEEVLILLPQDVCIIMLSATVPNPLEFANWVGRTKRKKMYVVTTRKRPVPLEHYLYTATGGRSKNERFLVLDSHNRFQDEGYLLAKEAKEGKKKGATTGPKGAGYGGLTPNQEATMLKALMDHLQKDERLPVIVFTLSRNRCDTNARSLTTLDLTTAREKHRVRVFFKRCLEKLKEPDRELPQVKDLEDMLKRGIGVHHSGILPILKEIVEMLFQNGCVKLLFATETFAMGVNMPARTVVFDSIRKFNGVITQTLMPAEYIQMAGRAGRRGQDTSGTVIILCKRDVPKKEDLKSMMLGKPEELTSQFRLTYSMILKCLRLEKLSVEDIMSRSFMEFGKQSKQDNYLREMKVVEEEIAKMSENAANSGRHITDATEIKLRELYAAASEYLSHWCATRAYVLAHRAHKELFPGRVILVTLEEHINKLAVILKSEVIRGEYKYHVLLLCDGENSSVTDGEIRLTLKIEQQNGKEKKNKKPDEWYKMLGLVYSGNVFVPSSTGGHAIVSVYAKDIIEICSGVMKINPEVIINDWLQRQQPRFRDREPGPTCAQAIQELTQISLNASDLTYLNIGANKVPDSEAVKRIKRMGVLMDDIRNFDVSAYPNFQEDFDKVYQRKELEKKRDYLKFLQSNQSMRLYPDYQSKVEVLRNLEYIDENNAVTLKGRVAIKMRNHELIITELVLRNALSGMQPEEIAALLSALVFQQKKNKDAVEPDLLEPLEKGKKCILDIEADISREEKKCGVEASPHLNQELNFELVNVVYDWARGEPFKHIMLQTDVQEGIIVRCIQQLHEMLRDVKDAAQIYGDPTLKEKMEEAQRTIKRDIVFAASLYTSETTFPKGDVDEEEQDMSKRDLS